MNYFQKENKYLFHTYKRIPIEITKGKGMYLYAKDGQKYLDMFGGIAVNALGYSDPEIIKAITSQSQKYIHVSNYFLQKPQIDLAEILIKKSGFDHVFFSNSGTEAIEGAIKITRKWGENHDKNNIISFSNSFHGRTFGALSLMDRANYREGFAPFLEGFSSVQYNDTNELEQKVNEKTSAIVLEFIQGEGGIIEATEEFVQKILLLKEKYNFILIADEIQSGLGRTGKLFSYQHYNIVPDIVVIAKPLGGGLPLGAILGNSNVADILQPGMHGSTFGGNPVACAAGIVVIKELTKQALMKNVKKIGKLFINHLHELKTKYPYLIKDIRGKGLIIGLELNQPGEIIVNEMRNKNILINCTNQNVLRFVPPLIIKKKHVDITIKALDQILKKL